MNIENLSTEEPDYILHDLRRFLNGASRGSKTCDLDFTRIALRLLKTLPASRDAILEYFGIVFDAAVRKYSSQVQNEALMNAPVVSSKQEDLVISEIHFVLCHFVNNSPTAWGPIISAWSLKLLGQLSSQYCVSKSKNVDLNEILHWWMSCKAARTLVSIVTQCFQALLDTDTDFCVSALLDTSISYSPHFDWVVAHVGSCFSKTIITRILALGLKDLYAKGWSMNSAKLKSVVGILGYLGSSHFIDIRAALLELFKWAFENDEAGVNNEQKPAVIPYLLKLGSKSSIILRALSTDVLQTLSINVMGKMLEWAPYWLRFFRDDYERLEDLVVALALNCEHGGPKIFQFLLEGTSHSNSSISTVCRVLLELLLHEIDMEQRVRKAESVPIVESIRSEIHEIQELLLNSDKLIRYSTCRMIRLLGLGNVSPIVNAIAYVLSNAKTSAEVKIILQLVALNQNLLTVPSGDKSELTLAIEQSIRHNKVMSSDSPQLWLNIAFLLSFEFKKDDNRIKLIQKAVVNNLGGLSEALASSSQIEIKHAIATIIDKLPTDSFSKLPIQLLMRLTGIACNYFFICVQSKDDGLLVMICRRACNLLKNICLNSTVCRSLALRKLLESALFLSCSSFFGSKRIPNYPNLKRDYLLSEENYKVGVTAILARKQSNTFGTTNVSFKTSEPEILSQTVIDRNILFFLDAIKSCCYVKGTCNEIVLSADGLTQVALLMVELISPDVMYNGLPWPEEDFQKVTAERDMIVRKVFDDVPLAWHILEFLARHEPALCYCSVLIRALVASVMAQWTAPFAKSSICLLDTTLRILNVMCVGQLLPPPLSSIREVLPRVQPNEVLAILRDCVWNYMRDHVPSPALFSQDPRSGFMWRDLSAAKPPPIYTQTLRLILLKNIDSFVDLYSALFVQYPEPS